MRCLGGVELHISNGPRRLQTQCAGEQRFDLNAQDFSSGNSPVDMWTGSNAACPHVHRARLRPAILSVGFHTKRRGARKTSPEDITAWAREHMAAYKVPRMVEFVSALPKSGSGKVMWRLLQDQEAATPQAAP